VTRRILLAAASALLLSACADAPSAPAAYPDGSLSGRPNAAKAPAELPNVFRYWDDRYGFFIADPASGLILVEGAPLDPRTYWMCPGGTSGTSGKTYQQVGLRQGVIHNLVVGDDVTLHVYLLSDYVGGDPLSFLCGATPIAVGTGDVRVTDNDILGTSGRRNSFGTSMHGTVTLLATGETLRASGTFHQLYFPETAAIDVKVSTVRLH